MLLYVPNDVLGRNFTAHDSWVAHLFEIQRTPLHKHSLGKIRLGSGTGKKPWELELRANLIGCKFNEMLGCILGIRISSLVVSRAVQTVLGLL